MQLQLSTNFHQIVFENVETIENVFMKSYLALSFPQ